MGTLDGDRPKSFKYARQRDNEFGKLTEDEIAEIREKARLKVELELKDKQEKELLDQFIEEERKLHVPASQTEPICLELAPTMPYIMLDGTQYLSGQLYYVTSGVRAVLLEQMNRGWAHEELTQVRSDSGYSRRPAHVGVGNFMGNRVPRDMRVSAAALAGTSAANLLGIGT